MLAHAREPAHDGALANDLGVEADVGRAGCAAGETLHVGDAAHALQLSRQLQALGDSEYVGRFVLFDQPRDGAIDLAMIVAIEILVGHHVADAFPGLVVQQQSAQHRLLGLDRMLWQFQPGNLLLGGSLVVQRENGSARSVGGH